MKRKIASLLVVAGVANAALGNSLTGYAKPEAVRGLGLFRFWARKNLLTITPMQSPEHERRHRAFLAAAQLRHPWQFRLRGQSEHNDPIEIDVGPGWHGLLQQLFLAAERSVPERERGGFRWRRLRAFQGGLDIRFDGVRDRVMGAVTVARDTAALTCEACGQAGLRRQVAGHHQVSCDHDFIERLLASRGIGHAAMRRWWHTPQPSLGRRSPATVLASGHVPEVLIDQALRDAMPTLPRLTGAHRQRLQGAWPVLREIFGERLRSLRLAEFEPSLGTGGTLLGLINGEADTAAQAAAVNRLARTGFSDLRLRLVSQDALACPAKADDPWSAMLALEASVSIPRYQPGLTF